MKKLLILIFLLIGTGSVYAASPSPTPTNPAMTSTTSTNSNGQTCTTDEFTLCAPADAAPSYKDFTCEPGGNMDCSKGAVTETAPSISFSCKQTLCATPTPIPPPGPCGDGKSCPTAFGDIKTDPSGFIKSIFGIILSLAGGIAIILIMISGYRLMSSQGNPEKVQAAREQLTSAIVGLLFIIFSITILQIIGVDILHIPGLTR